MKEARILDLLCLSDHQRSDPIVVSATATVGAAPSSSSPPENDGDARERSSIINFPRLSTPLLSLPLTSRLRTQALFSLFFPEGVFPELIFFVADADAASSEA